MKNFQELNRDITYALQECEIAYSDLKTSYLQESLVISIDKEIPKEKLKKFVNYLNESNLHFQSSFSPNTGFIKFTVFNPESVGV
ncbi:hypothetical protein [Emticicia sp. 17c]|uniref:hypothetical protein n=1 Tax=Emticicia sp. 17c TaxID=3127704 RepID=UPI00301D6171